MLLLISELSMAAGDNSVTNLENKDALEELVRLPM